VQVEVAFSQDQLAKEYVMHKVKEQGALVCAMLLQGGGVYVAGSAKRMPRAVKQALAEVLVEHAGMDSAAAEKLLAQLVQAKKYIVEAWS
jgi:sulfite reductase (NADPH) flavoprotein alpha-component